MPLLTCRDVSMGYERAPVLEEISFVLEPGEYLCIVGENGAGKSTLIKGLLGLMRPLAGEIRFEGLRQTEIGYLPQQTVVQKDFPATVREVVLSGCQNRGGFPPFYNHRDKQRAAENMERLGITDLRGRSYRDLSGGQQQRVLLARALCAADKLLLLDEPTAGLDPIVSAELYELVAALNRNGMAVIMVSHDVRGAAAYGDKVLHLAHTPLFFGPAEEYLSTWLGRRMTGGDAHA